ncbi:MAG: gliding motility-associated C-terminal domain-containing protein, partial [Chitinophagaceae bacterium]
VIEPPKIELGNDTTLCKGQQLELMPDIMAYFTPPGFYKWSVPSNNNFLKVTESGTYWCRAEKYGCVNADTIRVSFLDKAAIFLGNDTALCVGDSVIIKPAIHKGNVIWNGELGDNQLMVKQTGTIIAGLPLPGCNLTDTISVVFKLKPNIQLPSDTAYCKGKGVMLDPKMPGARILWNNMWEMPNLYVNTLSNLRVQVWNDGCYAEKNIQIRELPLPDIQLGDDRLVCDSLNTTINANSLSAVSYLWNTLQTSKNLLVANTGRYYVNVKDANGCENADTVQITFNNSPKIFLGADTAICDGDSWELKHTQEGNFNYLWHNTSSANSYVVKTPGTYFVDISNNCGTASDTIQVKKGICSLQMPTAFTPNNDGLNDVFRLKNHQFVKDFYMVIFNRQQEKVFESRDVNVGWNGFYKGKLANPETYIWYISLTDKQGQKQTHSGQVVLLRN